MSDRLAEIQERVDAATPGPWSNMRDCDVWLTAPDTDLIAHAPDDLRFLLDEVRRLRKRGGIARSLIPASRVEKFHQACEEFHV